MKYYISFPISLHCNLRCSYCFYKDFYSHIDEGVGTNKWRSCRPFSLEDYRRWRDKHLSDGTDFIMHLFGGEPFCSQNIEDVFSIIEWVDKERIDILSNGICDISVIQRLEQHKHKFHRIGFTYHRRILDRNPALIERYNRNVSFAKKLGFSVYAKELLIKEYRDKIVEHKRFWLSQGVDFKIQDFKGMDRGISQEEYKKYAPIDYLLVDPEYKHGQVCSCLYGYKNVFIRGFDMADVWPKGGDVVACWHFPTVVGNIIEDWFNPNYIIIRQVDGKMKVKGVPEIFRGTFKNDLPQSKNQ